MVWYDMVRYDTIRYIHSDTIQYNTIQYNTKQYNTIQYNVIWCNTIRCDEPVYHEMLGDLVEEKKLKTDGLKIETNEKKLRDKKVCRKFVKSLCFCRYFQVSCIHFLLCILFFHFFCFNIRFFHTSNIWYFF